MRRRDKMGKVAQWNIVVFHQNNHPQQISGSKIYEKAPKCGP